MEARLKQSLARVLGSALLLALSSAFAHAAASGKAAWIDVSAPIDPQTAPVYPGNAPIKLEFMLDQAKGDRLDIHAVGPGCSGHAWPNFEASCLRRAGTKGQTNVREARLVTADRTP